MPAPGPGRWAEVQPPAVAMQVQYVQYGQPAQYAVPQVQYVQQPVQQVQYAQQPVQQAAPQVSVCTTWKSTGSCIFGDFCQYRHELDPVVAQPAVQYAVAQPVVAAPEQRGDWLCPSCGDLQFARNTQCRRCATPYPGPQFHAAPAAGKGGKGCGGKGGKDTPRPGDWNCPNCGYMLYANRTECRRCGTPKPEGAGLDVVPQQTGFAHKPALPGDWICPGCSDLVFAKHPVCRRCQTPNPNGSPGVNPNGPVADLASLPPGQCRYYAAGYCKHGNSCQYAHGDGTQQAAGGPIVVAAPQQPQVAAGGGFGCARAPGAMPSVALAMRQCKFYARGSCRDGEACRYAHGEKAGAGMAGVQVAAEPWRCPGCQQLVFPQFPNCLNCKTAKPADFGQPAGAAPMLTAAGEEVVAQPAVTLAPGLSDGSVMAIVAAANAVAAGEALPPAQPLHEGGDGRARSRSPHFA